MRIISWNIHNRPSLWDDVAALDADIALLQEAPAPPASVLHCVQIPHDEPWQTAGESRRNWRTAIVGLSDRVKLNARRLRPVDSCSPEELPVSRSGTLAVAEATLGEERLTLVSMYGVWEKPDVSTGSSWIYADASVHRLISDVSALIGRQRDHKIIAAGDLNVLLGYGEYGSPYWGDRYDTVFTRMAALGVSFVGPQHPEGGAQASPWPEELPRDSRNIPTFRTTQAKPETATRQLDFVFASDSLHDRLRVRALNSEADWGSSDHCRVLIDVAEPCDHQGKTFIHVGQVSSLPEAAPAQVEAPPKVTRERVARPSRNKKGELYIQFWTQLLEKAGAITDLHRISPKSESYVSASRGKLHMGYGLNPSPHVYLWIGRSTREENLAIFSDLESKKPEIEKEYGAPFTWDPEPNKRSSGCWIWVTVSETPFSSDQGNWEDVQNEMIDAMIRFDQALSPHIERYREGGPPGS